MCASSRLFPDRFNVHLRLDNGPLIHMQKWGIWSKPVFVGNDSDTDWGAVGHDERPSLYLPVVALSLSLSLWKRKGWSLPGGVEWGVEDKEHSREMALVKDWHRPPHWDVNLNRGSVGWGLSYSCWWEGLGLLAGVGGPGRVTIWCCWEPLPSHPLIQIYTFIFHFVW